MELGVAFAWHVHPWEELLGLVRRAEALGYAAAFVDGDASMLERRSRADVLDGWTVTAALLAQTERIAVGSMRLAHHWNAARLAQAAATAERMAPGRLRFLISAGDRVSDRHFGLGLASPSERVQRLDETLTALRALWRGDTVTLRGRYVQLEGARVRPTPPRGHLRIAVAAKGPVMLDVVATHADVWEVNLPPIPHRVESAAAQLARACRERGRDPGEIGRSMWIFTRVDPADAAAALAEYRNLNPWFRDLPDAEIAPSLVLGSAGECRERLEALTRTLRLDLPIVDLSGLDAAATRSSLEALAPK
jgi:alkanesulfonate monooxygenase SsuD/methylene tetrahydromethanopterin reductase-like flavin-dependent oxidoreductase (luciferase family)